MCIRDSIKGMETRPGQGRKPIMDCYDEEAVRKAIEEDRQSVSKACLLYTSQLIKSITECHIVVAYIESNRHWLLLAVDVCHVELVGMIIYMRNLGGCLLYTSRCV